MYAWLWERLPFGLAGKLAIAGVAVATIVALLWFFVFPLLDPLLPFNDAQVTPN